jgi:NAD(P)-dependent dehydrogenase (short-subunit alcohol dehydrogenase family)
MSNLNGKTALITGAKGGLGTAVTNAYLAAGARVIGVSRSIQASDFSHPNFAALPAELSSLAAAQQTVTNAIARFGRIDVLVHVLGGFAGGQSVADTDDATMDKMLQLNFLSAFHILRAVLPAMRAQKAGRIVVVASRQGVEPAANLSAYSASKAALVSLVKTVALENKDAGITANTVLARRHGHALQSGTEPHPHRPSRLAARLSGQRRSGAVTGAAIPVYGTQL